MSRELDCIVIGYNEVPFSRYESFLRNYGEDAEAYRDLKFSFVDLGERKLDYVGLMNHVSTLAAGNGTQEPYKSGDIPNLAAAYLTTFLRRNGFAARYVNLFQYEKQRLIDFRQITTAAVGYAEVAPLAERTRTRPLARHVRAAMLVREPVQMGLARMFQILNEHPLVTMRIFEDEASARAWIATESLHDREDVL